MYPQLLPGGWNTNMSGVEGVRSGGWGGGWKEVRDEGVEEKRNRENKKRRWGVLVDRQTTYTYYSVSTHRHILYEFQWERERKKERERERERESEREREREIQREWERVRERERERARERVKERESLTCPTKFCTGTLEDLIGCFNFGWKCNCFGERDFPLPMDEALPISAGYWVLQHWLWSWFGLKHHPWYRGRRWGRGSVPRSEWKYPQGASQRD